MPEYSLEQASDLAHMAINGLRDEPDDGGHRRRNCLYLALLSMELSLKASLEKAGVPVSEIRRLSHRLYELHRIFVEKCSYTYSFDTDKVPRIGRGAVIRDLRVADDSGWLTFGYLMHATTWTSFAKYPGELRYGEKNPVHFDPKLVSLLAAKLASWLQTRFETLSLVSTRSSEL